MKYFYSAIFRRLIWLAAFWLSIVSVGCGPYSPFSDLFPADRIHVSIPEGYEGNILIAWEVPDGEVAMKEDGAWQYRLQEDGALLLQNDAPQKVIWSFAYESPDGSQNPLPQSTCFEDAPEKGVVVCTGVELLTFDTIDLKSNAGFTVTTIEDYLDRKWDEDEEFYRLFRRYLDRIALPKQAG